MKFEIKHEIPGRVRVHICRKRRELSIEQADEIELFLSGLEGVERVKIYERTSDIVVYYTGSRRALFRELSHYSLNGTSSSVPADTGRALNREYKEKLIGRVGIHLVKTFCFPCALRNALTCLRAVRFLAKGIRTLMRGRLEVEVLDATAITVSIVRRDFSTAGSVMFLLGIGELLEEWTHKKSVGDLARSMSLNIDKVWQETEGTQILVPISQIREGDVIVVRMGSVIPLDGIVVSGEAMVNQASMTGESLPVKKDEGSYAYAGTAIEEGEISIRVKQAAGSTRFERIVTMIEESQKLKSGAEGRAQTLADALVPFSLGGTALTWLLTRNATKAISVLMVDFSCALKLAIPLSVLSAMREAGGHHITVKGGKYLESVAEADAIVFDKTGTLTKAQPVVADVVSFNGHSKNDLLRLAACLEEHFPHSIANAVVSEAVSRGLIHEEMHSKVDYIVAHGIATYVDGERVVIGSYHFVFEDEGCVIPPEKKALLASIPPEYSHLYLAVGGILAGVILIEDPLREEAASVVAGLRSRGITKTVMMTGDSEHTAKAIASRVGVDVYFSEVLPEDKAAFVEEERRRGHKVIMTGDGINDSPALSAADVGIAISEGAQIAREIADITISQDDLRQLVVLKEISNRLMKRIDANYHFVIGFNLALILLGVGGVLSPATSALLHNTSTVAISLKSMTNLLEDEKS